MKSFIEFITEEGEGGGEGVHANNSEASTGIMKYDPLLGGKKLKARRSQPQSVGSVVRIPDTPSHG